jgi:hypothetical protein
LKKIFVKKPGRAGLFLFKRVLLGGWPRETILSRCIWCNSAAPETPAAETPARLRRHRRSLLNKRFAEIATAMMRRTSVLWSEN